MVLFRGFFPPKVTQSVVFLLFVLQIIADRGSIQQVDVGTDEARVCSLTGFKKKVSPITTVGKNGANSTKGRDRSLTFYL